MNERGPWLLSDTFYSKKQVLKKKTARCFDVLQVGFDSDHLYSFFTVHNQTVLVMDR